MLRLLVGEVSRGLATRRGPDDSPLLIETNIDDLDPRLWPGVLAALLEAGASDAWLTPILMKKGRPAHTLPVLVAGDRADAVRRRSSGRPRRSASASEVGKHALDREMRVSVDGHPVAVKLARLDGEVVNAQPEYGGRRPRRRAHRPSVIDVCQGRPRSSRWSSRPMRAGR